MTPTTHFALVAAAMLVATVNDSCKRPQPTHHETAPDINSIADMLVSNMEAIMSDVAPKHDIVGVHRQVPVHQGGRDIHIRHEGWVDIAVEMGTGTTGRFHTLFVIRPGPDLDVTSTIRDIAWMRTVLVVAPHGPLSFHGLGTHEAHHFPAYKWAAITSSASHAGAFKAAGIHWVQAPSL